LGEVDSNHFNDVKPYHSNTKNLSLKLLIYCNADVSQFWRTLSYAESQ